MSYTRISARRGQDVELNMNFVHGGVAADPYSIYKINIYRGSVSDQNLVAEFINPTINVSSEPGQLTFVWSIPSDVVVPDVYFDVWYFFGSDPGTSVVDEAELQQNCEKFWVYPDQWYASGGLETIRFGFEPLDIKFKKSESRPLEVGIMPLPLYDYNYNLVAPLIPYLTPTITICTENCEILRDDVACTMKIRQGAFRSNPWLISYMIDTTQFFVGTYKYRVKLGLPDGSSRVSQDFYFTVS